MNDKLTSEIAEQRRLLESLVLSYNDSIRRMEQEGRMEAFGRPPQDPAFRKNRATIQQDRQSRGLFELRDLLIADSKMNVPVGRRLPIPAEQVPLRVPLKSPEPPRRPFVHVENHQPRVDEVVDESYMEFEGYSDATADRPPSDMDEVADRESSSGETAQSSEIPKTADESQGHRGKNKLVLFERGPTFTSPPNDQSHHDKHQSSSSPKIPTVHSQADLSKNSAPSDINTFLRGLAQGDSFGYLGARARLRPHFESRQTASKEARQATSELLSKWTSMSSEGIAETEEQAALPPESEEDQRWLKEMLEVCDRIRFEESCEQQRSGESYGRYESYDSGRLHFDESDDDYLPYGPRTSRQKGRRRPDTAEPSGPQFYSKHRGRGDDPFTEPFVPHGYPYHPHLAGSEPLFTLTSALVQAQEKQSRAVAEVAAVIERMVMGLVSKYRGGEIGKLEWLHELTSKAFEEKLKSQEIGFKMREEELTRQTKTEVEEMVRRAGIEAEEKVKRAEAARQLEKEMNFAKRIYIFGVRDKHRLHKSFKQDLGLHAVFGGGSNLVISENAMHGTLLWSSPAMAATSEVYEVLKAHGWKVLWM